MEPEILCLDEITNGLDPENASTILESIRKLKATSTILLMVTHNIAFARRTADHVIFLDGGSILKQGSVQDVLLNPDHSRIKRFLAAVDSFEDEPSASATPKRFEP